MLAFVYGVAATALGVWLSVALATGQWLAADTDEYLVFRWLTTTIEFLLIAGGVS